MTQLFHFFDNSKPGYGLHQVYWIDGATVSGTLDAVNGSNAWRQNSEVLIPPQEYFVDMWREACRLIADRLPAGQLVCLDMEHIPHVKPDGTSDYSYLVTLARTFRQRMPGTRLSFLLPDLPYNRQDVRSTRIKLDPKTYGDLPDLIDEVCIGVYLLGAADLKRDLNYIGEMRRIVKRAFPKLRIGFSVWGRYHSAWNKTVAQYTIPPEVLTAYAKAVTRLGDNVVVYSPEAPRDDHFIGELKRFSRAD